VNLFDLFPGIHELNALVITKDRQFSQELTSQAISIHLQESTCAFSLGTWCIF
jgi:hypothetical protein